MRKQVLFIQGGGNGGYEADAELAASLQAELGSNYEVHYPQMLPDETIADFAPFWLNRIGKEISAAKSELILVGHSLGASMLLKYLSEIISQKALREFFLLHHLFGAETKIGFSLLNCKTVFLISCRKTSRLFSINARMMKWFHLHTSQPISNIFRGQLSVRWQTVAINLTMICPW